MVTHAASKHGTRQMMIFQRNGRMIGTVLVFFVDQTSEVPETSQVLRTYFAGGVPALTLVSVAASFGPSLGMIRTMLLLRMRRRTLELSSTLSVTSSSLMLATMPMMPDVVMTSSFF